MRPQLISDNATVCTRVFVVLVEGVFPFHQFPLCILDAHSAVKRVGFPKDPVLHGTGFLQTQVSGAWPPSGSGTGGALSGQLQPCQLASPLGPMPQGLE